MRAFVLSLAAVIGFLLMTTVMRTADVLVGPPTATQTGTASVDSCVEHGPVGLWGIGESFGCTADVRWDDGRVERLDFVPGQLRPGEQGVAVYSSAERGAEANPGRNDSARWFVAGRATVIVLALLTLWFVIGALASLWRLFRPARKHAGAHKQKEEWPVTKEEVAAAPVTWRDWRLRMLAVVCLGAGALEVLASIVRFDAPRRLGEFVSPWPHLGQAWLVDPPRGTFLVVGAVSALLCALMAGTVRKETARVVRYGEPYLKRKRLKPGSRRMGGTIVLALLTVWAVVFAVRAAPADAPVVVWLASGRDAVILLALTMTWFLTRPPQNDRWQVPVPKGEPPRQ